MIFCHFAVAENQPPELESSPTSVDKSITFKQENTIDGVFLAKMVAVLVFLFLLVIGILLLLKKLGFGINSPVAGKTQYISLIEVKRLSPKTTLFLIRQNGVQMLIGQAGDNLVVLNKSGDGSIATDPQDQRQITTS